MWSLLFYNLESKPAHENALFIQMGLCMAIAKAKQAKIIPLSYSVVKRPLKPLRVTIFSLLAFCFLSGIFHTHL
jgi:hypothetical protein